MKRLIGFAFAALSFAAFGYTGTPTENGFRAYPPSCLSDPLPSLPTDGPVPLGGQISLPLQAPFEAQAETVQVYLWRAPCQGGRSAVLGSIGRSAANFGKFPTPGFPLIKITQGGSTIQARVAGEPNTVRSALYNGIPIIDVTSFVFENFSNAALLQVDFNKAMVVDFYDESGQFKLTSGALGDYDPTAYFGNSVSMPITGYNSGAYYDSTHGGEGMLVQVIDVGNGPFFFAAWYTFDNFGLPYWLTVQGAFTKGATQISVPMYYTLGGGFAGNFTPPIKAQPWGTMTVSFPDCNTMAFSYNGAVPSDSNSPAGSGSKTWHRIGTINGFICN